MRKLIGSIVPFIQSAWYVLCLLPGVFFDPIAVAKHFRLLAPTVTVDPQVVRLVTGFIVVLAMFIWFHRQRVAYEDRGPAFAMTIEEIMFGGHMEEPDGQKAYPVIAIVSIRSFGSMPSILSQWKMSIRRHNGTIDRLRPTHFLGPLEFGTDKGRLVLGPEDALSEKLSQPLAVGAYETGYIVGVSFDPNIRHLGEDDLIVVEAKDILNRPHEALRSRRGADPDHEIMHYPRLRTQRILSRGK